eukprot:3089522-Rhodomonas_salina.1
MHSHPKDSNCLPFAANFGVHDASRTVQIPTKGKSKNETASCRRDLEVPPVPGYPVPGYPGTQGTRVAHKYEREYPVGKTEHQGLLCRPGSGTW